MIDLTEIIVNLGQSLGSISRLVQGLSYLIGMVTIFISLDKIREVSMRSSGNTVPFIPMCFLFGGALLLYLPSYVQVMSNSFFGVETNPLAYEENWSDTTSYLYYIVQFIQVGGLIFFIRGTVLLMQASLPGAQHGLKGLAFILGGIMMMNYEQTQELLDALLQAFYTWRNSAN